MSRFTSEQIEKQIIDTLMAAGNSREIAHSAAIAGANHYINNPKATALTALAWAKTFLKSSKRIKSPAVKKLSKRK